MTTFADDSAFSRTGCEFSSEPTDLGAGGLTKREYFAAMALQGLVAAKYKAEGGQINSSYVSHKATELADALIEQLNK